MDALLPSEIARLVLGYLQEQKLEEVAKMFLETSPHLQECKLVAQRGGRYGTKVGGLSLVDMLDKYCAANAIVEEKLNKVSDSEQIKYCNDITEQLRYLLEGSRGHRFVVNINVPTQNSPNGSFGTPTLSNSSRKRQHSGSDRGKRVVKSLNNFLEKDSQTPSELNCDTIQATPIESLPGHKPLTKQIRAEIHTNNIINKSPSKCDFIQNAAKESRSNVFTSVGTQSDFNMIQHTLDYQQIETALTNNIVETSHKCTEGTSTEQPMNYCSTEVQTTPLDLFDTENDINYEPIANLSIFTEELINRKELAEQIAENINKSIIPIQEYSHENPDANLSLLQGFDNAVKSAVETTDKVLEGLFNEIFTVTDNNINLEEDSNRRHSQEINNVEPMDVANDTEFMISHNGQQSKRPEVPLKQRLRSSSRSQINPDEDERDCNTLLENQNEEAIRSIVANVMASKQCSPPAITESSTVSNVQQQEYIIPDEIPPTGNENVEPNKKTNNMKPAKPRKNLRKPRIPKQKPSKIEVTAEEIKLQEQNITTMPTLILCSENDVQTAPIRSRIPIKFDGYIPIAPKPPSSSTLSVLQERPPKTQAAPKIFLRTVNVPSHLVKPAQLEATAAANQLIMQMQASPQKSITTTTSCSGSPIVVPIVIADDKQQQQRGGQQGAESITLYGGDTNSEVKVPAPVTSMPVISLDESACSFAAGTGLSPFFKGNADIEVTTTQLDKDQLKTVNRKNIAEAENCTQAMDKNNESEQQNYDKKVYKIERSEIEENKKVKANKTNSTIVNVVPSADETVCIKKENNAAKKVDKQIESRTEKKSSDLKKETLTSEIREDNVDDMIFPAKSECKVNNQSNILEKEPSKMEKMSTALKKDTKTEEKSVPRKEDSKSEDESVPGVNDKSEEKSVLVKINRKLEEQTNSESNAKKSMRVADVLMTKRTPKSLLKDRSKNNRLSLSTPRRRNSHVRALDFDEKTPEHSANARKLPQSCTKPKSSVVQGLFQSPPFSGETPSVTIAEPIPEPKPARTHVLVPPIATRSPAPKLQGNWNKVAGIGMILGDSESSPEKSQSSLNLSSTITEDKEPPKSWDSDLRKIVGDVNEEEDKRPKSAKKCRRRNSIRGKTIEEVVQPKSANKNDSKTPTPVVSQEHLKTTPPPASLKPKVNVPMKTSPELLAQFRNLQTPCKIETINVPPTPRVMFATPGTCLVKIGSGKEVSIKDCVNTPDFPPTPCILLTPKIVEEEEHEKKPSPYYEPSEESISKEIVNNEKIVVQQVTTTVATQKKNIVELQESKTVEITKFGVIEENMAQKEIKEVESTSEDNSKEIIEEESMEETNASADTTNTDSDSDSDSDSNSSTSSSSSNSSSSDSSSCSSNASTPSKSVNVSHHDNSTTESEMDSPQKVVNDLSQVSREEPIRESSPEKENVPSQVLEETNPQEEELTSTISAIITNEKAVTNPPTKPKIVNVQKILPPTGISEQLTRAAKLSLQLEEKRQRVMAKFKQTANLKRPLNTKRVTTVKKAEATQTVKKVTKQESIKKVKPSPKKKISEVNNEELKPKNTLENEKENLKTKVDQVKRDLFAQGDEAEQRTTRSQSARKADENPPLPGVLECLQLIPANKSTDESHDLTTEGLSNRQTNILEVSFVYDESVPIKKRKRNYSSSELENEYAFTFPDEDEVRIMKVQPYEEIFKLAPKAIKKKSPKKSPIKAKRKIVRCPLAASSPIKKDKLPKTKLCKRKASPIKEEKQVEKKNKVEEKVSLDPQALFQKIDVDKFLKAVHVSK